MARKGENMSNNSPATHITQIKDGSVLHGNLKSEDSIRVDGHITGDLISKEKIIVGNNGQIGGNLNGADITVEGFVNGDVIATGYLHITAQAKIFGKIFAKELSIDRGAELHGKVNVGSEVEIPEANTTSSPSRSIRSNPSSAPIISDDEEKTDNYGSVAW